MSQVEQKAALYSAPFQLTAFALFGAALWLCTRPFTLGDNDTQLYSLMALAWRDPSRFHDDLLLRFGSQDSFSIFSPVYGTAIGWFGLARANAILLLMSAALWLWGSWRLTHQLIDHAVKSRAVFLAIATFHIHYAGYAVMSPGEGQLTSRILAEGFGLLALADLVDRRWLRGAALVVLAGFLHPLMTMGVVAVSGLTLALYRPQLLLLVPLGVGATLGLSALNVPPFNQLSETVDPLWMEQIRNHDGFVFLETWSRFDWARLVVQAMLLLSASRLVDGWRRRALVSTVIVAGIGVFVAWLGGDRLHNALIIQLQPWRLCWPMAWVAIPSVGILVTPRRGPAGWVAATLFGLALFVPWPWLVVGSGVAGVLALALASRLSRLTSLAVLGVAGAILLALVGRIVLYADLRYALLKPIGLEAGTLNSVRELAFLTIPVLVIVAIRFPRIAAGSAVVALLIGLGTWDQRSAWTRYTTSGVKPPVEVTGPVLWTPFSDGTWFLLRQPAFVSFQQAAALVFSRDQALTWQSRMINSRGVISTETWKPTNRQISQCSDADHRTTAAELAAICSAKDRPNSLITSRPIEGASPATKFTTPAAREVVCLKNKDLKRISQQEFYVYRCAGDAGASLVSYSKDATGIAEP